MEWMILITIPLYVLAYLLLVPFFLEVDTTAGIFSFKIYGLAGCKLFVSDNSLFLDINISAWHKKVDLFAPKRQKKNLKKKAPGKKRKIKFGKILGVIKSFKIDKLRLILDSGNEQLNGILFPAFELASHQLRRTIKINFLDRNELELIIENNLARMVWAYLKS